MDYLKQEAIALIEKIPEKNMPSIMGILYDLAKLVTPVDPQEELRKKREAYERLTKSILEDHRPAPPDFDADKELMDALEEKYDLVGR